MKKNKPNWVYLPMRKCIRTRVDLDLGTVEAQNRKRWFVVVWTSVRVTPSIIEQAKAIRDGRN